MIRRAKEIGARCVNFSLELVMICGFAEVVDSAKGSNVAAVIVLDCVGSYEGSYNGVGEGGLRDMGPPVLWAGYSALRVG